METLVSIKTDAANKIVTINEASGGKPEHAVNNLVVKIDSITRISFAVENQ